MLLAPLTLFVTARYFPALDQGYASCPCVDPYPLSGPGTGSANCSKAAVEKVTEEIEAEEDAAELPVEFENSRTSYREHVPFEVKARVVAGRVSPAKGL